MPPTRERHSLWLRGLAEPLLATAGVFALTLLLTVPFVPTRLQLEVALHPKPGASTVSHERLERRAERQGLAEKAEVLLVDGASRLVLEGVEDGDDVDATVGDLLRRSGYQADEPLRREVVHMEGLLRADPRRLPIVMSIQAVVLSLCGLGLARHRLEVPVVEPSTSGGRALLLGVAAGIVAVVFSAVVGALLNLIGLPVEEQAWLSEIYSDPATLLRISPWVVLIAPVSEEVFFRLYVFRFIAAHAGIPAGLIASSLMFALIHLNPSGLLVYLGIGCLLAWVYQRTGRLLAPIAGHVTLNAIVLISAGLAIRLDL